MVPVDYHSLLRWTALYLLLTPLFLAQGGSYARAAEPTTQSSIVPFRTVAGFAIVVPVMVNGRGPYDFLFDTGSTVTAVDRELGSILALNLQGQGTVTSLVRKFPVSLAVAQSVTVGPITKVNLEVIVRDLDGLRAADPLIRGVLGQNALDTADYLIDYERRVVQFDLDGEVLSSLQGPRRELIRVPLQDNREYSNLAVSVEITEGPRADKTLLLDSGTASVVLFADNSSVSSFSGPDMVKDAAGKTQSAARRVVHLCLYPLCWDVRAHVVEFHDNNEQIRGLLPTSLFTRLYVSSRGSFMIANPRRLRRPRNAATAAKKDAGVVGTAFTGL